MYNTPMLREDALQGRVIIVTGGGTGLGKSMAQYLLQCGANTVITSRKLEVLKASAIELESNAQGTKCLPIACDIRNHLDVENLLQEAIAHYGYVNGLINNAAGNFISPTERLKPKAFDVVTDIVLRGTYNMTLTLGKYWIEKNIPASVLNIVTTYASTGSGYVVPSAMAKAGVETMTKSLAVEWAKYKIRMNAIAPGPFPTQGAWSRLFPKGLEELYDPIKRIPVGRYGNHQELANLAAYLLSDYAAFINGETVTIDGGEWLRGAGEFNDLEKIPAHMWDLIEATIRKKNEG